MKRKKNILLVVPILLFLFHSHAQNLHSFYPFKGFHIGLTGQAEYIQKCSFVYLTGSDPVPIPKWTSGWETGVEFSYHFAKYFGISVGINYGTAFSYNRDFYISSYQDFMDGWKERNRYESSPSSMYENEILFPIKLEFHYPLRKDLFFTAEAGVKIKGIFQRLAYGKDGIGTYIKGFAITIGYNPETDAYICGSFYDDFGIRNIGKISCNLLLGIGLYYKLPYGDLLRFTAGVNVSFNNIIEGYYKYYLTESYGTFAVKNDFIYTQLSYIHTLNWQKAKKHLKLQEYQFSSTKEQRKKIVELLK